MKIEDYVCSRSIEELQLLFADYEQLVFDSGIVQANAPLRIAAFNVFGTTPNEAAGGEMEAIGKCVAYVLAKAMINELKDF